MPGLNTLHEPSAFAPRRQERASGGIKALSWQQLLKRSLQNFKLVGDLSDLVNQLVDR